MRETLQDVALIAIVPFGFWKVGTIEKFFKDM